MLYIGTSGWQYDDWKGRFYPEKMTTAGWLQYYADRFASVEVNNTFYRLPERKTFEKWRKGTPDDFVVTVKANRFLTHLKRLKDPGPVVKTLMDAAEGLGPKLGPVLLQLPPNFPANAERLEEALKAFPKSVRLAVEFRHPTWFTDEVRAVLERRDAAFCLADRHSKALGAEWRTASWGYLRMHEGDADPHPCYRDETLYRWADLLAGQFQPSEDVYVYFNNDHRCCAIRDAIRFAEVGAEKGLQPSRTARDRTDPVTAADFIPEGASLPELREASQACRGCDLWENATQTVFGEGPAPAKLMLVGEQPGDREDREGSPFVGPAGRLLDQALESAGLNRDDVYLSNVVKHFKWTPKGKRRIHQKPNAQEISACVPWLREELARVQPKVLVCLGATAAQALLGRTFKVTQRRGEPVESDLAPCVMATVHPSSILRARDDESRRLEMKDFIQDLEVAASKVK